MEMQFIRWILLAWLITIGIVAGDLANEQRSRPHTLEKRFNGLGIITQGLLACSHIQKGHFLSRSHRIHWTPSSNVHSLAAGRDRITSPPRIGITRFLDTLKHVERELQPNTAKKHYDPAIHASKVEPSLSEPVDRDKNVIPPSELWTKIIEHIQNHMADITLKPTAHEFANREGRLKISNNITYMAYDIPSVLNGQGELVFPKSADGESKRGISRLIVAFDRISGLPQSFYLTRDHYMTFYNIDRYIGLHSRHKVNAPIPFMQNKLY